MKKLIKQVEALEAQLKSNKGLQVSKFDFFNSPANIAELKQFRETGKFQQKTLDFYKECSGFQIEWEPEEALLKENDIVGRVKINPIQQVIRVWEGSVYFEDEPAHSPKRKFFPMDYFAPEAAVGFCTLEGYQDMMFIYYFQFDLVPLHVDMEGYLQLLLMTRGCYYWQNLIREIAEGKSNTESERIKEYLPGLFPDFSFQTFSDHFNKIKIN